MLQFNTEQDFGNLSFGEKPRVADGWNTLTVKEVGEVRNEKSGNANGVFITFEDEHGATFDSYFCVEVYNAADSWRVSNTEAFLSYLAKCANFKPSDLASFVGARFDGLVATREVKGRAYLDATTGELVTPPTRQVQDFARGKLTDILKPANNELPF